ncbi:MAG: class I SAM-dependent methyltransferase [Janthinobacterium lividum]
MGEIIERTIPSKPLTWTGERLTSEAGGQVEIEHLHRYLLARDHCRGLDVLDVAAGEGYGTALLAQVAKSATGVEISGEAAAHAAREYIRPNLRYLQGDARKIPMGDASVDVVVSFETVEHLFEQDVFLSEIKRVLRPGGRLVMSSPNSEAYSPPGSEANPYHVRELSRLEFVDLVGRHFGHVQLLAQRPMLGSVLVAEGDRAAGATVTLERRGGTHFERSDGLAQALYFLAVASDAPLEPVANSVFIESGEIGPIIGQSASYAPTRDALLEAVARAEKAEAAFHASREEIAKCMSEASDERGAAAARIAGLEAEIAARTAQTTVAEAAAAKAEAALATASAASAAAATTAVAAQSEPSRLLLLQANKDRDLARAALRRAAIQAGLSWKDRFALVSERASEAERHARILADQLIEARAETVLWRSRYDGLRGRLERFIRRFGVLHLVRLMPGGIRRTMRDTIIPPGQV